MWSTVLNCEEQFLICCFNYYLHSRHRREVSLFTLSDEFEKLQNLIELEMIFFFQSRSSSNATIGANRPSEVDDDDDEPPQPQQRTGRAGSTSMTRPREGSLSTPSTMRRPIPSSSSSSSVGPSQQHPPSSAQAAKPARKVAPSPQTARRTLSPRKAPVKFLFD